MKAEGYLQIVPLHPNGNPEKGVTGARIERLTKTYPRQPEPGAIVVKVSIDVDAAIFQAPTLSMVLDGDASEVAAAVVPIPIPADDSEVS